MRHASSVDAPDADVACQAPLARLADIRCALARLHATDASPVADAAVDDLTHDAPLAAIPSPICAADNHVHLRRAIPIRSAYTRLARWLTAAVLFASKKQHSVALSGADAALVALSGATGSI